jgi:hypothetical protein
MRPTLVKPSPTGSIIRATKLNGRVGSFIRALLVGSYGNLDPDFTFSIQQQKRPSGGGSLTLHVRLV